MPVKKAELKITTRDEKKAVGVIHKALQDFITKIPETGEKLAEDPTARSRSIANNAAVKAAGVAGSLALPPGPLGLITIIPDLVAIWKIQSQMVADIAAAFGKEANLTRSQMIYCLFKHSAGQVVRDLVVRAGQRVIVKRTTLRFIETVLKRVGIRVLQRTTGKILARWMPIVGAVGIGAYAYYDTAQVGKSAIELFSKEIIVE